MINDGSRSHSSGAHGGKSKQVGVQRQRSRSVKARILRYPDGTVRRILYPSVERDARSSPHHDNGVELSTSSYDVASSTFGVNANETLRRRGSSATEVPDTVNSLLAMVRSPELRQKRLKEEDRIRSSYTVCELCPFSDFKQKVSVIANVATGEVICLEVLKPDTRDNVVTDRLDSVIKRQIVIQGILIFAQENDAELYVRAMEDEGLVSKSTQESEKTLVVCEVEAGDIFTLANASHSVGIVFKEEISTPSPTLLRQVLRAKEVSPEEGLNL